MSKNKLADIDGELGVYRWKLINVWARIDRHKEEEYEIRKVILSLENKKRRLLEIQGGLYASSAKTGA